MFCLAPTNKTSDTEWYDVSVNGNRPPGLHKTNNSHQLPNHSLRTLLLRFLASLTSKGWYSPRLCFGILLVMFASKFCPSVCHSQHPSRTELVLNREVISRRKHDSAQLIRCPKMCANCLHYQDFTGVWLQCTYTPNPSKEKSLIAVLK